MPETEPVFYLSWVDKRTDPWPMWEKVTEPTQAQLAVDRPLRILPPDHAEWPGTPFIDGTATPTVSDERMGRYPWPGIPYTEEGRPGRLFLGPTLSALFAPGSRFLNLEDLRGVFLLFQPERPGSPHQQLEEKIAAICARRGIMDAAARVRFRPIAGLTDPTDYTAIIECLQKWLLDDPFDLGSKAAAKTTTRIVVNLSPGTPAMSTCWLILRWNGSLGGSRTVVEFVQGSGGLHLAGQSSSPLRTVPIETLSRMIGKKPAVLERAQKPPEFLGLENLTGPPFDALRQKIEQAAMLGLPILLQGPRGSGKTVAAQFYHQRRRYWREHRGQDGAPTAATPALKKTTRPRPASMTTREHTARTGPDEYPQDDPRDKFVIVTLSEYSDLEHLRHTLFGWAKDAWNRGFERYDGLLGEAHRGTLFLDEIHHLDKQLQAALLEPLNSHRYRPMMARYRVISQFDLVVATNDLQWRAKLTDDFRDRIERIVLEMPAFRAFQRVNVETIWRFWEFTLRRRCEECGLDDGTGDGDAGWIACRGQLLGLFKLHPLPGNWRDLQRLADNLLMRLTDARGGRPTALCWDPAKLEHAIAETFGGL